MKLAVLGLAALALGACAPAAGTEERTVVLTIEHSAFDPTEIEVQEGERVRFVVRNNDPIDHELIIGDEEVQDLHEKGTEKHHGARDGEVSVAGGDDATTAYTFDEPGTLIFGCHLPGHYDYGMKGTITVRG